MGLSNVQKLRERFNKILVGERGPTITVEENKQDAAQKAAYFVSNIIEDKKAVND